MLLYFSRGLPCKMPGVQLDSPQYDEAKTQGAKMACHPDDGSSPMNPDDSSSPMNTPAYFLNASILLMFYFVFN